MIDWIIEVTCKDRSYGARPLRRAIQRYVEDPLSEELIRGHLHGGEIEVYLDAGAAGVPGPPASSTPAGSWPDDVYRPGDGSERRSESLPSCRRLLHGLARQFSTV